MTDFPFLTDLPSLLLEQVIAKLDWKSYFRLQQTCHQMEEFVRTNRKLYTRVDKNANFKWIPTGNGRPGLFLQFSTGTLSIASVYGIRLNLLAPPRHVEMGFLEFCEVLKRHRISCTYLFLYERPGGFELPKEQCTHLIKILKPVRIQIDSPSSNRVEALLDSGKLKQLYVYDVDPHKICSHIPDFIRHRYVKLVAICRTPYTPEEIVTILASVRQILHSVAQLNENLQKFVLRINWNSELRKDLLERIQQRMPSLLEDVHDETSGTRYHITMPAESKCSILVDSESSTILYHR